MRSHTIRHVVTRQYTHETIAEVGKRVRHQLAATALATALAAVTFATVAGCDQLDDRFCANGNCGWSQAETNRVTALADLPAVAPPDPSNKYADNPDAVALGHQLFYDKRFSGTSTMADALGRSVPYARAAKGQPLNIACATCHDLQGGSADPSSLPGNVSLGASWTDTNASSIWNSGFQTLYLWNGRSDSMWAQATATIETAMGSNRLHAAWVIATYYRAAYEAVFTDEAFPIPEGVTADPRFPPEGKPGKAGCTPDDATEPFGDAFDCMAAEDKDAITRVAVNFGKAVAAYEMRLITRDSPFDKFVADLRAGKADQSTAISSGAKYGARLFVGKAGCSDCHNTPLLSDGGFYNVGVLQEGPGVPTVADCPAGSTVCDCTTPSKCLPFGAFDGRIKLAASPYRRDSKWADPPTDNSRARFYEPPVDNLKGAFRVPSLRNVAQSAPYMHDGALATLEDVVALYNRGGEPEAVGVRAARVKPLLLTDDEQAALVAFLRSLNGIPVAPELTVAPALP